MVINLSALNSTNSQGRPSLIAAETSPLKKKNSSAFSSMTTSFTNSISVVKTIASILLRVICSSFNSGISMFIGQETRSSTFCSTMGCLILRLDNGSLAVLQKRVRVGKFSWTKMSNMVEVPLGMVLSSRQKLVPSMTFDNSDEIVVSLFLDFWRILAFISSFWSSFPWFFCRIYKFQPRCLASRVSFFHMFLAVTSFNQVSVRKQLYLEDSRIVPVRLLFQ